MSAKAESWQNLLRHQTPAFGFLTFAQYFNRAEWYGELRMARFALHGLTELACRYHHDLDLVIGRREFGFNGRPRWCISRRHPGIPHRVHLREIRHVRDPDIGRE
jgi:hypothetical protein